MDYAIASVFVYKSNSEQSFDLDKPVLSFIPTLLYTDFTKRPQQPFELTPLEHVVVSLIHWLLLAQTTTKALPPGRNTRIRCAKNLLRNAFVERW